MKGIGYALAFCFIIGIYGCSQKDAGTNSNNDNQAVKDSADKDSLLKAASKLNASDSIKETIKDTTVKNDKKPESH